MTLNGAIVNVVAGDDMPAVITGVINKMIGCIPFGFQDPELSKITSS